MKVIDKLADWTYNTFLKDIYVDLRRANIKKDPIEYARTAVLYFIATAVSLTGVFTMLAYYFYKHYKTPNVIVIFILLSIVAVFFSYLGIVLFLRYYPKAIANARKRKIEANLYLATLNMATVATSGSNPITLFKVLANRKEFGEISKEAKDIINLSEGLGIDLPTALHIKAKYSPSPQWAEVLEGIRSILVEGGDLESFLYDKASQFIQDFKRKLIEYSNTMQVVLEIYITLVIVGVIFVLILTTLMGAIFGSYSDYIKTIQYIVVLGVLPIASILFIVMIKIMNPFSA